MTTLHHMAVPTRILLCSVLLLVGPASRPLLGQASLEVTEVMITGITDGVINAVVGGTVRGRLQAFRSRLRGDAAATVDWANKESLDFNEIWDNVLLNLAWKKELAEEAEGGN